MPLSTIAANQIKQGTIVDANINSSANIATTKLGTGAIIQTQKTVVSTTDTITMTNYQVVDMTGLSVNITPQFSNSIQTDSGGCGIGINGAIKTEYTTSYWARN